MSEAEEKVVNTETETKVETPSDEKDQNPSANQGYTFNKEKVRRDSPFGEWLHQAYGYDVQIVTRNQREQMKKHSDRFWKHHALSEKKFYREVLENRETPLEGTLAELAEHFQVEDYIMAGLIQGGNEALEQQVELEELMPDTPVVLKYNLELLYKAMLINKANYLYNLPEWDEVLPRAQRNEMYHELLAANQAPKVVKIGRNDPCPCGSGKKYKQCCGRNA